MTKGPLESIFMIIIIIIIVPVLVIVIIIKGDVTNVAVYSLGWSHFLVPCIFLTRQPHV